MKVGHNLAMVLISMWSFVSGQLIRLYRLFWSDRISLSSRKILIYNDRRL